ncbi:HEAT repeat domain-containing protein [Kribbella sp. NPDC050124]|uniref:HEAT repeat domain-containing protein n=1 Tax=Kribbella sp. NPDC050124 TaxID=3364114 RepID=UPI0037A55AAD
MDDRIIRIRAKLAQAAESPALLESFGAKTHSYRLKPPLSEAEVAAFEAEHEVGLPTEYRLFLLEAGDGGAGSSYGLVPLRDALDWDEDPVGFLAAPSYLADGVAHGDEEYCEFPEPRQGSLAVVHHGCAYYTHLVVSGPGRGRLVNVNADWCDPPYVSEDPDFLTWYERWLDELLAGYSVTDFGQKLPGDETALLAILAGDPDPDRRVRAAWSLSYLPDFRASAGNGLAAAAADPDPRVREAALGVGWRSTVRQVETAARTALTDSAAPVRAAAIHVLRVLGTADLAERARALLADADSAVMWAAAWALTDSGDCQVADLEPLLTRLAAGDRVSAVYYAVKAHGDATGLLRRALGDLDADVRRQAVQSAEQRKERSLLRDLRKLQATETDPVVRANLDRVVGTWRSRWPVLRGRR